MIIGQSLPNDLSHRIAKAVRVVHWVPIVPTECLFIHIPEQMERLDAHIRSFDASLEERPEVFKPVRMDMAFRVALDMIYHVVDIFVCEVAVRF